MKYAISILLLAAAAAAQTSAPPCAGLPPGKHSLLERFTADFGLTCDQQLKIEPLLHDEESVSKPLLKFTALPAADSQEIMLKVKLAARRQIKPLLTPDQQKQMDQEIESTAKAGAKKGGKKNVAPPPPATFADEEALSKAVQVYAALNAEEKKAILLKVKTVAIASLTLTDDQRKTLESEIRGLK